MADNDQHDGNEQNRRRAGRNVRLALMLGAIVALLYVSFIVKNL